MRSEHCKPGRWCAPAIDGDSEINANIQSIKPGIDPARAKCFCGRERRVQVVRCSVDVEAPNIKIDEDGGYSRQ